MLYKPADLPTLTDLYWYVQAKDSLGNWGPWSASRKVFVFPLRAAAPKLTFPANNSATKNQTPTFTWSDVLYDDYYQIQIATDTKFLVIVDQTEEPLATKSYTSLTTLPEGKYYWHVRAKNSMGVYGDWSAYRTFFIDLTPPAAPLLNAPTAGKEVAGTPNFTWSVPLSAKSFTFEYAPTADFASPTTYVSILRANFKPSTMIPQGDWYWHVKALDSAGNEGAFSAPHLIHILPAVPGKSNLVKPAQGIYTDQSTVEFEWTASNYASYYQLQFDDSSTFGSPIYVTTPDPSGPMLSVNIGSTLTPGKWYWRIRGVNSNSVAGLWSVSRYFYLTEEISVNFSSLADKNYFTEYDNGEKWYVDPINGYLVNDGVVDSWDTSSIAYSSYFSNFTVESRMKMDEGTNGSEAGYYGLIIRGKQWGGTYLTEYTGGYTFQISQQNGTGFGCFSVRVYNYKNFDYTELGGFCDPIIHASDWNTLRVSANGKYLKFFVNDTLLWRGVNTTYSSGRVGVFSWSDMTCVDDWCEEMYGDPGRMYVDNFYLGAPENSITSASDILVPNSQYGVAPKSEKRYSIP